MSPSKYNTTCPKCGLDNEVNTMLIILQAKDEYNGGEALMYRETYYHECVGCGDRFDSQIRTSVENSVYTIRTVQDIKEEERTYLAGKGIKYAR